MGPYVSQNCLDKPEIKNLEVIEPSDLENMHNNQNNNEGSKNVHVRFKDDPTNNKGYIDLNTSRDINENPASLRNLKDAFNNFSNRRPSKRDNKSSNLPVLPMTNNNDQDDNNVYSITKSYNQNDDYNDQLQQQFQQQQQPRQSFENLYSQVRVQPNRNANNDNYLPQNNNMYGNEVNNEMVNPNVNDDYYNQQPVYMNTSYDDYNQQQSNSQRTNSKSNRLI